jgi:hypothetical protein
MILKKWFSCKRFLVVDKNSSKVSMFSRFGQISWIICCKAKTRFSTSSFLTFRRHFWQHQTSSFSYKTIPENQDWIKFYDNNRREVMGKGKLNELYDSTKHFPYYYRDWSKLPDHCIFLKDEKLKTYIPWWGTKVLWLRQRTHIWVVVGLTGWFKQS